LHISAMLAASLGVLSLQGCISASSFEEPSWSLPVQAQPLREIAAVQPQQQVAIETSASTAEAQFAASPPAPDPAPPERTGIRGAGDGSMKLERVTITARKKDIPHREPDFSREQVASMVCIARPYGYDEKNLRKAVAAWQATVAAHDSRTAFEAGKLSMDEADRIELKRQDAIGEFRGGGTVAFFFDLMGGMVSKKDLPKPASDSLALENVDLFTFTENGQEVMAVSGVVRNTGANAADVPPLTLQALDRWEYILAGQSSLLPFETLAPGAFETFEVRFLNPPDTTYEVYAHFAPPFEYRARRDCANFDPAAAKVPPRTEPRIAAVSTAPTHTAAELNELTRRYRSEAEYAWACRRGAATTYDGNGGLRFGVDGSGERREAFSLSLGKPDMSRYCAPATQRVRWREMFEMAQAADEAWGAARGVEEMKLKLETGQAAQSEAEAATLAHATAYASLRLLGDRALARVGGSASGVLVENPMSSFGNYKGRYVLVSGRLHNTSDAPQTVDQLMVAIVDRLDMPLLSISIENPVTLAPGQFVGFSHRIPLMSEPTRRMDQEELPKWQVRIGAMAK
jgi:hypothetical protein